MTTPPTWKQKDTDYFFESASAAVQNPGGWLFSADRLRRAATELHKVVDQDFASMRSLVGTFQPAPVEVGSVMMMLLGYTLENLAKGIIVAKDPSAAQGKVKRPTALATDLNRHLDANLLVEAGLALSPDEEAQVARLRTFLEWGGRYPAATDSVKMMYAYPGQPPASFTTADLPVIDALIDRTRETLVATAQVRAAFDEAAVRAKVSAERPRVLAELDKLRSEQTDGMTFYYDDNAADTPGNQLVCCGCGMNFSFNERRPGAICGCGTLYHHVKKWDAALQRDLPTIEEYRQ